MKKLVVILVCLFSYSGVYASTTYENVKFSRCVDGDTAVFLVNDEEVKFRFLAVDTPETVHPTKDVEQYGEDASTYTCNKLTNASEIIVEYESSNKTDKYGRSLAWIWVDGELLQQKLVESGLAEVSYIYGNYRYTESLCLIQKDAKENLYGIWSSEREEGYCSTVDLSNAKNVISYNDIAGESEEDLKLSEETTEKLEKIEDAVDKADGLLDKYSDYYVYIFMGIAFVVMLYKEFKK